MGHVVRRIQLQRTEVQPVASSDYHKNKKTAKAGKSNGLTLSSALVVFLVAIALAYLLVGIAFDPDVLGNASEHTKAKDTVSFPMRSHGRNVTESKKYLRRFPKYGTEEFSDECKWVTEPKTNATCTIYVVPFKSSNEGIAWWVSKIAEAYQLAIIEGCNVLFQYKEGVDITSVMTPHTDAISFNWTVPLNFICSGNCSDLRRFKGARRGLRRFDSIPGLFDYRFAYASSETMWHYRDSFNSVEQILPGYHPESSMACSLGALFKLSSGANSYEPRLFSEILQKLQSEDALVLALYIRTGRTDAIARTELNTTVELKKEEDTAIYRHLSSLYEECAFSLEGRYLSGNATWESRSISRVVWMVVTDSQYMKEYMMKNHEGKDVNARIPKENQTYGGIIPRTILTTNSRGKHTKPNRKVETATFAEAFIDWYLIGEADVVIVDKHSTFGATGAMRTNRQLYRIGGTNEKCKHLAWLHEANERPATAARV